MIGIGGAPIRATILPEEPAARKTFPVASGVLDYFPDALAVVSNVSWAGNEQHNPGQPLHWARGKSMDEADTMIRHFLQRGTLDKDGIRHTAKMAWRALALLQKEIEGERKDDGGTLPAHEIKSADGDEPYCCHSMGAYLCTRVQGHEGQHVAHGVSDQVLAVSVIDDHGHESFVPGKKMGISELPR